MQKAFYLGYEKETAADFSKAKNPEAPRAARAFFSLKEDYADRTRNTAVEIQR